jgi:glycosyltransferase involved in cell wall biosynthesis
VTYTDLDSLRVVVVTSRLRPGYNELWEAARHHVGQLEVVGVKEPHVRLQAGEVGLRQVDLGRGMVSRHLVGLRRHLRSFRPHVVHVNTEPWSVTALELLGVPSVLTLHGAENLWEHGRLIERALRRRLVARAVTRIDGYASWNHSGADHVRSLRARVDGSALPTLVLPAIIPPEPFRSTHWAPSRPGPSRALRVLLVGRAVPAKGFATVVEAAAMLGQGAAQIKLCGEGSDLPSLVRLADERGVALETMGNVPAPELASVMADSDVLVQPSLTTDNWAEQFGRSVAEAMTVGLPALVSSSGELPHLVDEDPRAVFAEGDAARLAERLRALREDAGLLAALSHDQGLLAERYRPETAARSVLAFWAESLR